MWSFWDDLRSHRAAASLFLLLWLGTWALSLAPQGPIHLDPFMTHFALAPFAAAFLVAWWRRGSDRSSIFPISAPLAGLFVAEVGWGISFAYLILDVVLRTSQPSLFSPGWAVPMMMSGAFVMGIAGLVAGSVGALSGSLIAAIARHLRRRVRRPRSAQTT
jgi:hypothetical protein